MCSGNAASVGIAVRGMRDSCKEIRARRREVGNNTLGLLDFVLWVSRPLMVFR